jgi:hypothetical protein
LNRLENHFSCYNIIHQNQHGFQKGKSTVSALYSYVSEIYNALEHREKINVILYDFSNAFGCLHPLLLLSKLRLYGLSGKSVSWLGSFLLNRKQYVVLNNLDCNNHFINVNSDIISSSMGVPQGTVMGPACFTSYINDMPLYIVAASLIVFADDTTLIVKGDTFNDVNEKTVCQNDLFVNYSINNNLRLNSQKTRILQIRPSQARRLVKPVVKIGTEEISVERTGKLLGVNINDTINWLDQCRYVSSKLRMATFQFTKLKYKVNDSILKLVYNSYVQSHMLYSIVIWGGSNYLDLVFIAQKRALRALAGIRYWRCNEQLESCKPLFVRYEILTVYSLYILECMKYLTKNRVNFKRYSELGLDNRRQTRNSHKNACIYDLYVKNCDRKMLCQSPDVMIPRIFNALPVTIKMTECDTEFIGKVKKYVLENQFYSLKEFFSASDHER